MKVVILAGGLGTRLAEETDVLPKPMVEIGGHPILWHIMKIYGHFGFRDFVICLGYKGYVIKEYFCNYYQHNANFTIDLANNNIEMHKASSENWRVSLVETGRDTLTGGRLGRIRDYLGDETFCMTYGDGVANVDLHALLASHQSSNALATVTAVQPVSRFGAMQLEGDRVTRFKEKPVDESGYINGGFFVLSPKVLDLITGDDCIWEQGPLASLAQMGELNAYRHDGFWQPMDTLNEKRGLDQLCKEGRAPWMVWQEEAEHA